MFALSVGFVRSAARRGVDAAAGSAAAGSTRVRARCTDSTRSSRSSAWASAPSACSRARSRDSSGRRPAATDVRASWRIASTARCAMSPRVPHRSRPARRARRVCQARRAGRPRRPRPGRRRAPYAGDARSRRRCVRRSTDASERSRWRAARGSSSDVASSRTSVCGSASTSRASATCCACAGVSGWPPAPTTVSRPSGNASTHSSASTASRAASSSVAVASGRASLTFSSRVPTKTWCSCVTSATSWRSDSSGRSTRRTPPTSTRALARRMDAGEQAPEGRLAGARRPDDGDALARLEVEIDAVQHVAAVDVRVPHVLRREPLVGRLVVGRGAVGRDVRDPDQARERGCADLDLVEPRDQAIDRVGELHDVAARLPSPRRASRCRARRASRPTRAPPRPGGRRRTPPTGTRPYEGRACAARRCTRRGGRRRFARTRSSFRPSASIVRPPSTVSPTVPVSVAYDARSHR